MPVVNGDESANPSTIPVTSVTAIVDPGLVIFGGSNSAARGLLATLVVTSQPRQNEIRAISIECQYRGTTMANDDLLRHFYGGFVRLHILYHAAKENIYGIEMIRELKRHGYNMSPGTLYPILHDLRQSGYLVVEIEVVHGKRRKNYTITAKGRRLMENAKAKLRELFAEVIEDHDKLKEAKARRKPGRAISTRDTE
jgi:DNA-binding PadR family transcriptional regulator